MASITTTVGVMKKAVLAALFTLSLVLIYMSTNTATIRDASLGSAGSHQSDDIHLLEHIQRRLKLVEMKYEALKHNLEESNGRKLVTPPMNKVMMSTADQQQQGACQPKNKVAFAKTHKTGSSTLQNIFFRYGIARELVYAMPPKSWMFSFKEPFDANVVLQGPWKALEFDMFIFHSIWRYAEVKKILPSATYLTLLRDPVDSFESNYVYMGLQNAFKMDINEFARRKAAQGMLRRPTAIIGKNQLLWDLGVNNQEMENKQLVEKRISELDSEFDLVLMLDHFDESLVLMAEELCWPLDELTYLKQNERLGSSKSNITDETRTILRKWLWADYMLYDHFAAKFNARLRAFGQEEMDKKVDQLKHLNEKVRSDCVKEKSDNSKLKGEFRMALNIVYGYVIDESKPWCAVYARSEPNFTKQIRDVQTLKVTTKKLKGEIGP